jgi:methyl-accepting chemotaxis protein
MPFPRLIFTGITSQLLGILVLVIFGFLMIGTFAYFDSRQINQQWHNFQAQVTTRIQLLEEINRQFGYGGVIHHFKNYVLRHHPSYPERFNQNFAKLSDAFQRYQALPDLLPEEKQWLASIISVANAYKKNLTLAENLVKAGKNAQEIDKQVKIDDTPAITAMNALDKQFNLLAQQQTEQFQTRLTQNQQKIFFTSFVILILTGTFITLFIRHITVSLKEAVEITHSIADGNLNNIIKTRAGTQDETEKLLSHFAQMQTQLRERIESEKRIANEALRIKQALDHATTHLVITDRDFKVIYLNQAARNLFKTEEKNIQRDLPHFEADRIVGSSLDKFHEKPAHQHQILARLTKSHYATITVGGLTLDHIITPIINPKGESLGVVIEFNNRTHEVAMVQEINAVIHAASQGDLQQCVIENKSGFLKDLSQGINQIITLNKEILEDTMRVFAALAKGELTQFIEKTYFGTFEQLKTDANQTVEKLTAIITAIQKTATSVSLTAEDISQGNDSLKQRTEQQASSLQETAASMEQMTSTVQQNADNAKQATQLATTARSQAEKGGEVVGAAILAITEISRSSQRITDIIGVIDDIAFQTNLLALNASVEAARAGEQGRGFAVVAQEVRNLAQRSAAAAKEIKTLIEDGVVKVEEGTRLANQSGETLKEIVIAVKKVSDIIAEIAAASQEQSSGIHQVNNAIAQMEAMTQQNAEMVEALSGASQTMTNQAQNLQQQIAFFKINRLPQSTKTNS